MTTLTAGPGFSFQYTVMHEAHWARHIPGGQKPEIIVTKAADGGGATWEFVIRSGAAGRPVVQACVYNEAFSAFVEMAPLFETLAVERPGTLGEVQDILDRLGIVDVTERSAKGSAK